ISIASAPAPALPPRRPTRIATVIAPKLAAASSARATAVTPWLRPRSARGGQRGRACGKGPRVPRSAPASGASRDPRPPDEPGEQGSGGGPGGDAPGLDHAAPGPADRAEPVAGEREPEDRRPHRLQREHERGPGRARPPLRPRLHEEAERAREHAGHD